MKTCAKCCISRCSRHMYYGVRGFGHTSSLSLSQRLCLGTCQSSRKLVLTVLNLMSQTSNIISFWVQSRQTHKDSALGTNEKWKKTNENLQQMLCFKCRRPIYYATSFGRVTSISHRLPKGAASELIVRSGRKLV